MLNTFFFPFLAAPSCFAAASVATRPASTAWSASAVAARRTSKVGSTNSATPIHDRFGVDLFRLSRIAINLELFVEIKHAVNKCGWLKR